MAGASAEGEVNHWPAFVDVLTTVIMVVTFLLVIMSAAVMVLSQKAVERFKANYEATHQKDYDKPKDVPETVVAEASKGKQRNAIRSPRDAEDGTSVAELGSVLMSEQAPNGQDRLTIRTRETPDTLKLAVKAEERPDDTKGVRVQTADVLLRVDFEPLAVRYDEDNTRLVNEFLSTRKQPGVTYEIWSWAPQTSSVSEAQRLAFYRAAMTRNLLIRAGIPGASIKTQVRIGDAAAKDGHNVRVVVKP